MKVVFLTKSSFAYSGEKQMEFFMSSVLRESQANSFQENVHLFSSHANLLASFFETHQAVQNYRFKQNLVKQICKNIAVSTFFLCESGVHSESSQTSKMELLAKKLTEYASVIIPYG